MHYILFLLVTREDVVVGKLSKLAFVCQAQLQGYLRGWSGGIEVEDIIVLRIIVACL
jgi:hypothetical protein